jgi:hypothetical protein
MRKHELVRALMLGSVLAAGIVNGWGCADREGPAEKAGEKVDDAVDDMKDKVD